MAPRVLCLELGSVATFKEYCVHFEKEADIERCYVVYWEKRNLKKMYRLSTSGSSCSQCRTQTLARFIWSSGVPLLHLCIRGCSPSLLRVLSDNRSDDRQFIVLREIGEDSLLQCVRRAHEDVFGMVKVTTIVKYVVHRLKRALYEEWTEEKPLLRKCIGQLCGPAWAVKWSDLTVAYYMLLCTQYWGDWC